MSKAEVFSRENHIGMNHIGNTHDWFISAEDLEAMLKTFKPACTAYQGFEILYSARNVVIAVVGQEGGQLPFSDNSLKMTIPKGALEVPKLIHCFREVPTAELIDPNGTYVAMHSPIFNCGPDGTCFEMPVTLRFRHTITSADVGKGGKLQVYTRDGEKTYFDTDETGSFRIDGKWIEIKTSHFSDVAVGENVEKIAVDVNVEKKDKIKRLDLSGLMPSYKIVDLEPPQYKIVDLEPPQYTFRVVHTVSQRFRETNMGEQMIGDEEKKGEQMIGDEEKKAKVTAIYGEKTKKIVVERSNFTAVHNIVANRFELSCDFQLQVKDESGNMIDIDSDGDAADNVKLMHTVWVIPTDATTVKVVKPAVTADMLLVKVDSDAYSITETPEYKSVIVKKASSAIQKDVCIPSISAKLDEVEECLRIAYCATVDNKELRCKIQNMQFDIQKLCAECDTTMLKIKLRTVDILNELQCGFGYLLDGFEDFGLKRLGSVGPIAEDIQKEAASLTTMLSRQEAAVKGNLAQVEKHGDEKAKAFQHAEQQKRRAIVEEKHKEVWHSESEIKRLAEKEQSAVQTGRQHLESDSGIGFGFKKLITFGFYQGNKPRAEQEERFAREMREEQARERERLAELKKETIRAEVEFEKFLVNLNVQPKEMSKLAIQGAEDGLKTLGSFLQSLADFWKKNGAEFNSINDTAFLDLLRTESDPEKRERFWKSRPFKMEAMNYIARFVAIQKMCEDFHETMTRVLDDIHQCIRDNPTADEAKAKLPKLVEQFKEGNKARREREYAEEEDPYIEELS